MKRILSTGTLKYGILILALFSLGVFLSGCQTDEVDVPDLTGPSGARLFITIDAAPEKLVMKRAGKPRPSSRITIQLRDDKGQGVPNANIKVLIANAEGSEVNIGSLSQVDKRTDAGGFLRATYTAPNLAEQPVPTRIYIVAILRDAAFTFEVTGRHAIDLEAANLPINCVFGAPNAPEPSFTVTPDPGILGEPSCFDASATTDDGIVVNFEWSFGDGSSAQGQNVCHTFQEEGLFNVTLTVQDEDRNCASIVQLYEVGTGDEPTCTLTASPSAVDPGQSVNFFADVTSDGDITSFDWNFGDGTSTTTRTPEVAHTFRVSGSFTVTLTITDDRGNTSTCQITVTVGEEDFPDCVFTVSPTDPQVDQEVSFNASESTDPDGAVVAFEWDFGDDGDGTDATGEVVSHTFTEAGTFVVTLTVRDNDRNETTCSEEVTVTLGEPPICAFTVNPTTGAQPGDTITVDASESSDPEDGQPSFSWSFPGGNNTSAPADDETETVVYNTAGTFTITLTVSDTDGNEVSCSEDVVIGDDLAPDCQFTVNPDFGAVIGETITVDASGSSDPEGGDLSFLWSFPGGNNPTAPPTEVTEQVVYNDDGQFTITLTVTDEAGNDATCTRTVFIQEEANEAPTCSASGSPNPANIGQTVNFIGTANDPEGDPLTFTWNFADGSPEVNTQNASHQFTTSGNFTVTFTVEDDQGNQCVDEVNMVINPPSITINDVSSIEGDLLDLDPQVLTFTVSLSGESTSDVFVDFVVNDGTAVAPGDYVDNGGTIVIPAGSTSETIEVEIVRDDGAEPDETLTVVLSNAINGNLADPQGTGTILNDD